ncbi:GntR family transcriptional regulator [Paenibacillus sp. PL91]|uniref:GntR family transcriptional regulator n=1 Tax=Paenibacillus sp. PL91 TaxID=2729538 RepID=UPI00145D4BB4|nr:GntR family transcriptional regulator [Paenibacillus sp. PL91]MBC9200402.1 GntR family transcriptional regulator [Paenibacillus sp. PL91]
MSSEREPLYIQIQNYFKELISTRQLREDDKIPTEKEMIEQFKVSRITVANALNELAREGWIYRIPGRGTFVKGVPEQEISPEKSASAAALDSSSHSERPKIGLIFPFVDDYFAIRLIRGITDALEDSEYALVMMFSFNSKEREKEIIRDLKNKVEALIIFPVDAEIYNEEIIALKMSEYPFVLIDRYLPGVETNAVYSDSQLAAKLAVDHLWSLGHREIAICSDSPVPTVSVDDRINGYMNALRARGAMINPALLLTDFDSDMDMLGPEHPLFRYIKNRVATAFIALNGNLGFKIWSIAKRAGIKVPEELSIVTFDNPSPMMEDLSLFTHINQSESDMGLKAGELILNILKGKLLSTQNIRTVLEPKLVIKQTTAAINEL